MENKEITVKEIDVKEMCNRSKIEGINYVINPYVGCTFGCKFCYACFMKQFTKHAEPWGEFLDVKNWEEMNFSKKKGKKLIIGTVTDPYLPQEEMFRRTERLLKELEVFDGEVIIQTKSKLVLRDIPLLKKLKNPNIVISLSVFEEEVASELEGGVSVKERLDTLEALHKNGIKTTLSVSPIFPWITDLQKIIDAGRNFVDEFWFAGLELYSDFKGKVLKFIDNKFPDLREMYGKMYFEGDTSYWEKIKKDLPNICEGKAFKDKIKM